MPEEQSLSIEETNKLRISLGLKPLQVDPAPDATDTSKPNDTGETPEGGFDAEERQAVTNWQKHQDELEKAAFRAQQREEIRKAKEAAKRFAKLEGVGLADEGIDGEEEGGGGAAEWVKKMKKRQKKIAKKMAEELAERDRVAMEEKMGNVYTERDVRGLKVAHDESDFLDAGSDGMVLTLKDATLDELEEEGDELENVELGEKERLKKRLELKKKKPGYNAYDDDVDEDGNTKILGQYDEEIDPKKGKKKFTLGGIVGREARERSLEEDSAEARREAMKEKLKLTPINLDIESTFDIPHRS